MTATISIDPNNVGLLHRHVATVPVGSTLVCAPEQAAVFLQWGRVAGLLGPGEHRLDPTQLPFLSVLVEQRQDGAVLGGELLIANTAGVELDVPIRPELDAKVRVRVADPARMLGELAGPADPDAIAVFITEQLRAALAPAFADKNANQLSDPAACAALAEAALPPARDRLAAMALEIAGVQIGPKGGPVRARTEAMSAADAAAVMAASVSAPAAAAAAAVPAAPPAAPPAPAAAAAPPPLAVGARVRMSHAGAWYSGSITQLADAQCEIEWDSGQKSWVPRVALEPEPSYPGAHPAGTRVLAQWSDGGFYPATVRLFNGTSYQVAWENGQSTWLAPGQIKLA